MAERLEPGQSCLVRWSPGDGSTYEMGVVVLSEKSHVCGGTLLAVPLNTSRITRAFAFGGFRAGADYYAEKWQASPAGQAYDVYVYRTMLSAAMIAHAGIPVEDEAEFIRSGLRNDHDKSWAQPRFEAFDISTVKVFR